MRITRDTENKIQQFKCSDWQEGLNSMLNIISTLNAQIESLENRVEELELEGLERRKIK
jgi:hypothetical protein